MCVIFNSPLRVRHLVGLIPPERTDLKKTMRNQIDEQIKGLRGLGAWKTRKKHAAQFLIQMLYCWKTPVGSFFDKVLLYSLHIKTQLLKNRLSVSIKNPFLN